MIDSCVPTMRFYSFFLFASECCRADIDVNVECEAGPEMLGAVALY